ncbi:hypothetical protein FNV43_RR04742 [Rhamnella rubrinervis]|uniref:Thioredoxin domain-containing protein n=1 Tax=Rhamnella rubrinervis TaxID=2594499 RepID=A0A8K0MQW7_9ROSA|nr:hypothetical protein FNV43_RR04742 [Rhamnella rubrinervis]
MGAVLSWLGGYDAAEGSSSGPVAAADGSSSVQAFHSSERWQLHFNELKKSSTLMVIDFSATWCGPCKAMEPIFNALSAKFTDVDFVKIDVDELSDVAQEFGVQAMPTFVFVKKGKEVDRIVGGKKDDLEKKIEKHRAIRNGSL